MSSALEKKQPATELSGCRISPLAGKTFLLVERHELSRPGKSTGSIETQAGWNFGGNQTRYHVENLTPEKHEEAIDKLICHALLSAAQLRSCFGRFFDQTTIRLHSLGQNESHGIFHGHQNSRRFGPSIMPTLRHCPWAGHRESGLGSWEIRETNAFKWRS